MSARTAGRSRRSFVFLAWALASLGLAGCARKERQDGEGIRRHSEEGHRELDREREKGNR